MKEISHLSAKDHATKGGASHSWVIVSAEMTEKEIEEAVRKDILTLSSRHLRQPLEDLLSDRADDTEEVQLLKILVDQNKILIRQSELILRTLNRRSSITATQ